MRKEIWTLTLVGAGHAVAQNGTTPMPATSTFANPRVPTGVPIAGDYDGRYRPQVHFSPPRHFMNDPNGMFVDANGTWHLYYQYNPTANVAGNQHWGHATSQDLYHWTNQPIALFPPDEETFVFSGSAVIDVNNTSGFFPDQDNGVVAIYTLASYPDGQPGPQTQAIAYSRDGGYTFTPYEGNPVIDSDSSQFRDPKVVWVNDRWVMVIAYAQDFQIGIFTSDNLKDWTATSNFTGGLLGLQYECPNMIKVPHVDENGDRQDDKWLMAISINPGAPLGGSITEYFIGDFNGTHFEAVDDVARIADFGKDNYAGQWFYGQPEDEFPVSIAWASNWQYTQVVPTGGEGWRSVMSLPRENYLTKVERLGWKLVSRPYSLDPVLGETLASNSSLGNGTVVVDYSEVESNALYFEANVTNISNTSSFSAISTLNFTFSSVQTGEHVSGGFYFGGDAPFFVTRGGARGFDNVFFTDKFSTNSILKDKESWSVNGVIDRSIFEVFVEGGVESATNIFFSTQPLSLMTVSTADIPDDVDISVKVVGLESAWATMKDDDGLVSGNRSDTGSQNMRRLFGHI